MSHTIDGKQHAADMRQEAATEITQLVKQYNRPPGLAVILVGDDPASDIYVFNKIKYAQEIGMLSKPHFLATDTSEDALLELITQLNNDDAVDGILVQLPLPAPINSKLVLDAIDPDKDVDGLHPNNIGRLIQGKKVPVACTPLGCLKLLKQLLGSLYGLHAVVIGRSNIVGKPMAMLLLQNNCTVTITHSHTQNIQQICQQADIVIAAVGSPKMVTADWIKPGAVVIDVGINRITNGEGKTKLVGDVDFESVYPIAKAITPVPGGVGPMTIACLLYNTLESYKNKITK